MRFLARKRKSPTIIARLVGAWLLICANPAFGAEPKAATLDGRIEVLDRVFHRWVKGMALGETNPMNWKPDWWVGLGTEAEWDEAFAEWLRRNPAMAARLERGQKNQAQYHELVRAALPEYLQKYQPDTKATQRVFDSYVAFLRSQKVAAEKPRSPLEAERLAREEIEKTLAGLPAEERLPFAQWRNDPLIWRRFQAIKTRRELEAVRFDDKNVRRAAFDRWKEDQLRTLSSAIVANMRAAIQVARKTDWFKSLSLKEPGDGRFRELSAEEFAALDLELHTFGWLQTKEREPRHVFVNRDSVRLNYNYPGGAIAKRSFFPQKDAPLEFLGALEAMNGSLAEMKEVVTAARYDAPPIELLHKLQPYRNAGEALLSSPLQTAAPGSVPGPPGISEKLTALAWASKNPGAFTHFRPVITWPGAPTVEEIATREFKSARRRYWNLSVSFVKGSSFAAIVSAGLLLPTIYAAHLIRGRFDSFQLEGNRPAPSNSAHHEVGKRAVWQIRGDAQTDLSNLPTRFELSWVKDETGWRKLELGSKAEVAFRLESAIPLEFAKEGIAIPAPDGYELAFARLFSGGHELARGTSFEVRQSDAGHLAVTNELGTNLNGLRLELGYRRAEGDTYLPLAYDSAHFRSLDRDKVNRIATQMEEAGLRKAASEIKEIDKRYRLSVHDIERAIARSSLYSFYPEGEPKVGKHNPFWFVSRALNSDGVVCGDCDVVNEVTAVFLEEYFKGHPDVVVERGVLFTRKTTEDTLQVPLHGQVYLRSKSQGKKLVLDSTPWNFDPRDSRAGHAGPWFTSPPRELVGPFDHRRPYRAEVWERERVGVGPEPNRKREPEPEPDGVPPEPNPHLRARRRILDPLTQEALERLKEAKQSLLTALELSGAKARANERLPQKTVLQLVTLIVNYVEGELTDSQFREQLLRWLPEEQRAPHFDKPTSELLSALHARLSDTFARASKLAELARLSARYAYLTDPGMQRLILEPLALASQTNWKPAAWKEITVTPEEFNYRLKCKEVLKLVQKDA